MARRFSIFEAKFRRNMAVFFTLSSVLPLLILIFFIFQYVIPLLNEIQLHSFNRVFTYGVTAMLIPSLLSIAMGYRWVSSIEKLSKEIKAKTRLIGGTLPEFDNDENELAHIYGLFNEIHGDLESKMSELDDVTRKLLEANIKLEKMAVKDSLTDTFNRRYFDLRLIMETSRADRDKQDLSLMMIDFDNFKQFNDEHGHQTGDKLLQEVADIIRSSLRRSDMVFRYGGDEFAVLVPGCNLTKAEKLAEKFVTKISETQYKSASGKPLRKITISCGVAQYDGNLENFARAADQCLLAAKENGKGRVVVSLG